MHLLAWLIFYLVTSAVSYAVKRYIASRQKGLNEAPQEIPPVAAGTPIPILYGTQRLRPIPVWDGGEKLIPIKKQGQEIAKNHLERYQGILCWGEGEIIGMMFGDNPRLTTTRLKPTYFVDGSYHPVFSQPDLLDLLHGGYGLIEVFAPDIFAEFDGVGGNIYLHDGSGQAGADPIIVGVEGAGNVPSYSDMLYVVFDYFRLGMDRSRSTDFIVRKAGSIPGIGFSTTVGREIDGDAAAIAQGWRSWIHVDMTIPAVIYDLSMDNRYGLGMDPTEFDLNNFSEISRITSGQFGSGSIEVTGVSLALTGSQNDAKATVDECLRVLNAIMVRHPETNKYQIKLIRDEAPTPEAFAALRSFDHKQIRKCKVSTKEWSEVVNEVTIEWSNPAKMYELDTVVIRNDASIAAVGYRPQKMSFRSVTDQDLAVRIGIRELKAGSLRLERQTLKMTREAWDLERGDVIKVTYKKCSYQDRLLRVLAVNLGSAWSGEVTVDAVDDVFSHDGSGFTIDKGNNGRPQVPRMPVLTAAISYSVATGYVTLTLDDPDGRLTAPGVEFQTQVGGAPPSAWSTDSTIPFQTSVDRSKADLSVIRWRYTYVDENEDTVTSDIKEATFGLLGQISVDWSAWVDDLTGQIKVTVNGISFPSGIVLQKFWISLDDFVTFFEYDVQTGRAAPSPEYSGNPPPWIQTGLGTSIGGPLTPGQEGMLKIRVFGIQYDPIANADIAVQADDSLSVKRSAGKTVVATWNISSGSSGTPVGVGQYCSLAFPFAGTATKWKVQSTPASTSTFDLWRNNGGHALPTVADSLGESFGTTAHEVDEGTFGTPIDMAEGDNVIVAVIANDLGEQFTVSITIENVIT